MPSSRLLRMMEGEQDERRLRTDGPGNPLLPDGGRHDVFSCRIGDSDVRLLRNGYDDHRTAAFARGDGQCTLAHHFEPLADIFQRGMRLVVFDRVIAVAVVLPYYLVCRCCLSGGDGDMNRVAARFHAVLDGVLNDRLQRQRRHAEQGVRRVEIDK